MNKSKKLNPVFDLDKAIMEWSRRMKRSGALEDGMHAELEAHLRDEVEDLVEQGKSSKILPAGLGESSEKSGQTKKSCSY